MRRFAYVLALTCLATACGEVAPSGTEPDRVPISVQATTFPPRPVPLPRPTAETLTELVEGNTTLALELFRELSSGEEDNVLLGPASISEGLALPFLGARGHTAAEMADVLQYTLQGDDLHAAFGELRSQLASRENDGVEFAMANRAFGQDGYGFLDEYLADLSRFYQAPLGNVDFSGAAESARGEINDWTAGETNQRITDLFPAGSISPNTALVLVNATYLAADWHFPFNPELTRRAPFTLLDGSQVEVETMNFNEYLPTGFGEGWTAVQIPYSGEEMSMIVIAPDDFEGFLSSFDPARLEEVRGSITDGGIHLDLPKFELSYHTSLIEPLQALGLTAPFGPGADFSGMTGNPGLFVAAIEHETYVKIDEAGTEAAAATGTAMDGSHGPTVTVDRPFLFLIQDDATRSVLFLGKVVDP